ncbi:hypothetical protein MMC09_006464 [Bachmanniomyces sp. S44760]|nr:hypothetical protein [Bachmanniomyces sp. S44760]
MSYGTSKVLILTGAPEASTLQWDDAALTTPLLQVFSADIGIHVHQHPAPSSEESPVWRAITLERQHLPTGLTPAAPWVGTYDTYDPPKQIHDPATFLDLTAISRSFSDSEVPHDSSPTSSAEQEKYSSQFYDHSFAIHEQLTSSQTASDPSGGVSFTSTSSEYYSSNHESVSSSSHADGIVHPKPASGHLSDLLDIPDADYLHRIVPQTMTVNLIVGLISILQPRRINPRRGGTTLELVEMIVGDETRTGFGINIWLLPSQPDNALTSKLREITKVSRPQDIILIQNVALSSFRGKVYGQSLRKDVTKLDLLYRSPVDAYDRPGAYREQELGDGNMRDPQIAKVRKVRDWIIQFVGIDLKPIIRGRRDDVRHFVELPPDTP